MIEIFYSLNNVVNYHALLDSGSEAYFILEHFILRLCFSRKFTKVQTTCLGSYNADMNGEAELYFSHHFNSDLRVGTKAFLIKKKKHQMSI